jgi:hypothetical protein
MNALGEIGESRSARGERKFLGCISKSDSPALKGRVEHLQCSRAYFPGQPRANALGVEEP